MKITCSQFEGLISFYLNNELSDKLRTEFEAHLSVCPSCRIRYNVLNSIINELKEAYGQYASNDADDTFLYPEMTDKTGIRDDELSAYIDNELSDEFSVKMRRNIIARPVLRKKLEKLYNLRKIMTSAFAEQKNKLRRDYSGIVAQELNINRPSNYTYFYCFLLIIFVAGIILISTVMISSMI